MMKSLDNQDQMIQELSASRSYNEGLQRRLAYLVNNHEGFVRQIVEILSSNAPSVVGSTGFDRTEAFQLETDLMNAMQNSPKQTEDEDIAGLNMSPNRLARVRNQFIDKFRYDSMFDREAGVAEAHPDTLEWIFKDPGCESHTWDNFVQWLESEDRLYWITGKMGSGKSTLMKYISEELYPASASGRQRRCTPFLLRRTPDWPLCIATFYFWAGSSEETRIQTSVEGLYRTLLTQILEAFPDAAPHVSPRRWEKICLFNIDSKPLGITELKITLAKTIEYVSSKAKICLFIDGLDEFEGGDDDLNSLVTWVKTLVGTLPVKLCVASRPWRVFEDALQDRRHLFMENSNFKDIQQYVWRRFHDDPNFRAKEDMEVTFCNQLLHEIVKKAEGVFLWVHLVCTRLLQAMSRGDLIGDLRRILNSLPVQMKKLYSHILHNLDFKDQAAKYFLLLQACSGRADALIFSFADDIGEDQEFSLKIPTRALTQAQTEYRISELGKRLNSRCKGLLSIAADASDTSDTTMHSDIGTIQYCHRSAKDYLTMESVQKELDGMLEEQFDPHLRLCSAYFARWKCFSSDASKSESFTSIYKCVEHAAKSANKNNDIVIRILDDLDPRSEFDAKPYINHGHFGRDPWFGSSILSLVVNLGLTEYVKRKVGQGQGCVVGSSSYHLGAKLEPHDYTGRSVRSLDAQMSELGRMKRILEVSRTEKAEWPLLLDALLSTIQPNSKMVSLLLENGADANLIIRCGEWEKSASDAVLLRLRSMNDDELSDAHESWVDSLCLLLRYGLKPHRSDVQFLRKFLGEDVIRTLKLPHLSRYRLLISKHLDLYYLGS